MDEPASGLTHGEVDELGHTIQHIRDQFDLTVLLVEHHMSMVMSISDQVVAMEFGRKIAEGTPAEVQQRSGRHRGLPGERRHEPAAHAQALTAGYGPVRCCTSIDLEVDEGEIVVILGANGAGKTTTMRAISGTIARHGIGRRSTVTTSPRSAPDAIVRRGIAQVPQGRGTFPELSVEDNLRAGAFTRSGTRDRRRRSGELVRHFPRLDERRTQRPAASAAASSRCWRSPGR